MVDKYLNNELHRLLSVLVVLSYRVSVCRSCGVSKKYSGIYRANYSDATRSYLYVNMIELIHVFLRAVYNFIVCSLILTSCCLTC